MATRLKLDRAKLLEACRTALDATEAEVARVQAEQEAYDWRAEARERLDELETIIEDAEDTSAFTDALYKAAREFKHDDYYHDLQRLRGRAENIQDLINISELKTEDEVSVSTTDSFVTSILRQARRASETS